MQDQTFEVTPKRQLTLLSSVILVQSILIYAYLHFFGLKGDLTFLWIYLGIFMFDALPTIILHLQYLSANRNAVLVVRQRQRTLSYTRKKEHLDYSFDDIAEVVYVAGYGGGAWYSFSEYRYFVLAFKDGKSILISCLMIKFDKMLLEEMFGIPVKAKIMGMPFVKNLNRLTS